MNYLLVLPNDTAIGFEDLDQAKWRLNSYHEERIKVKDNEELYSSVDMFEEKSREDLSILIGAEEGEGKIYSIESLLENIRESDLFEEEKEEIIGRKYKL